jgi:hypothetical protein
VGKTLAFGVAVALFALPVVFMGRYVHAATDSLILGIIIGFAAGGVFGGFLSIPFLLGCEFLREALAPGLRPAHPVAGVLAERQGQPLPAAERFPAHDPAAIARAVEGPLFAVGRAAYDQDPAAARREPVWSTAELSSRSRERPAA